MADRITRAKLYYRKWRWFERNALPWRRLAIHLEMMRRECYARMPIHGNVLGSLREGRFELGRHVHFEHDVWISVLENGRLRIGDHVSLNAGVFVSVFEAVEIGPHTAIGNGSFIADSMHSFEPGETPWLQQPMTGEGPVRIGHNVWIGVNSVVTSNVTIGDWCIIGANSVVTRDIPSYSVAVGSPARVIKQLSPDDFRAERARLEAADSAV